MKKIFGMLLVLMLSMAGWAQNTGEYNPENPADPDVYYRLTLEASPLSGGTASTYSGKYLSAGQSCSVSASPRLGYVFKHWMMGDKVVSTNSNFSFTMPEHDAVLTAYFEWSPDYNPENPSDPDAEGYSHKVRVYAVPSAGGYFNSSSFTLLEGKTTNIYAYPREGYCFESWMVNGEVVSTDNPLNIKMGTSDMSYTATFTYNPVSPGEPSPNVFNAATGEVVIDNFTPGSLNSALSTTIGGSDNYALVQSITVIGRMQSSDFGFARNCRNCSMVDLSRTTGYTEVPSWSFDGAESLKELYLPMNVEHIGTSAFTGCTALKDIYLYAVTPPTLAENALTGLGKGVSIHVPSSAVALFAAADGWNRLNIQSLDQNEKSVTVNLPGAAGTYKNMTLELHNMQSGQVYRCLVTDRTSYTFFGLMRDTYYSVYLKNSSNVVLGELANIALEDKNLAVNLDKIRSVHDVTLSVLTPDGSNVTADVTVTWLDEKGNHLRQGNKVSELLEGANVRYQLKLGKDLAMEYVQPEAMVYEVKEGNNAIQFTLSPLKQITLSGCVKDVATKQGISGASVSISQTLNGKYSKTIIVKTDNKGNYSATVYNAPTSLAVSAYDYVNQMTEVSVDPSSESVAADDIFLSSIIGATINLNLTYTPSVAEGETAETQNWYDDYQNVVYSLYNMTTGKSLTQVSVRYPQLVVLDGVKAGDRLKITASSKKDAFMPVDVEAVVDSINIVDVTIPILEYGRIQASYLNSENEQVVGVLYDGNGCLLKAYDYDSGSELTIDKVKDGNYTLLTMGKNMTYNSIYYLSRAHELLLESVDFRQNTFTIESGRIQVIQTETVPHFDEDKFLYIDREKSYFRSDNGSVVAGNYLTFAGNVAFEDVDLSEMSNLKFVIDLPPSLHFVDKSIMIGNKQISNYVLEGNTLTIPYQNQATDKIKFCVIPTESGNYSLNAMLTFTANSHDTAIGIGNATFEVKNISIHVPSLVASANIMVNGTASENSRVEVYDEETLIGQTLTQGDGLWSCTATLDNPYNLSSHYIHAKIISDQGYELISESKLCQYDKDASIDISKVIMYHWNPEVNGWKGKNFEVIFDFQNPDNQPASYVYYIYNRKFTFTIDFTVNAPDLISDVVLYVNTGDGTWTALDAEYNETINKWTAEGEFGNMYDGNIPVNVAVDFRCKPHDFLTDSEELHAAENYIDGLKSAVEMASLDANSLLERLFVECEKENPNFSLINTIVDNIYSTLGLSHTDDESIDINDEQAFTELLNDLEQTISSGLNSGTEDILKMDFEQLAKYQGLSDDITIGDCSSLRQEDLLAQGFEVKQLDDSTQVYIKVDEYTYQYVSFKSNKYVIINIDNEIAQARVALSSNAPPLINRVIDGITFLSNKVNEVNNGLQTIKNYIDAFEAASRATLGISKSVFTKSLHNYLSYVNARANGKSLPFQGALERRFKTVAQKAGKVMQGSRTVVKWVGDSKLAKVGGKVASAFNIISNLNKAIENLQQVVNLYNGVPSCEAVSTSAEEIRIDIASLGVQVFNFYSLNVLKDIVCIKTAIVSAAALAPSEGTSVVPLLGALGGITLGVVLDGAYEWGFNSNMQMFESRIQNMKFKCNEKPQKEDEPKGKKSNNRNSKNTIDPAGYVYEGVSSNRLQGVTATAYYKETTEDKYGILHEEARVWDASEYAQENPLFTDENGMYQWFVPQGMWQVKFEKEGYETTYSEWLPVPPPQLEVNVAMTQARQPEVKKAHAYEDGVEVEFDKYMLPSLLTADNILVSQNGQYVEGEVKMLNEETAYRDDNVKYVSKVRFVPKAPFTAKEVTLTVANRVKSYAGIQMQDTYQQTFDIEKELKEIKVESELSVTTSKGHTLLVEVLPAATSSGKTLTVKSSSDMIVTTDAKSYTLDSDGKASVVVKGDLPGTAALTFSVEGYDLSATTTVSVNLPVNDFCAAPTASVASGSKVTPGTEIRLSCATDDAVIYYTLDGSCPCDESDARKIYDGTPIIINEAVTIKAMAVAEGIGESDVVEFTYTIKKESLKYYTYESLVQTLEDREEWTNLRTQKPNAVAVVENEQTEWASQQKNVLVKNSNGSYTCADFLLTDLSQGYSSNASEAAKTGFFTPVSFSVTQGTYKRQAYAGYNTLCLPFSFKTSELSSSAKVFTFDAYDADKTKVVFKAVSGTIAAGTPCIVKEKADVVWTVNLSGKTIEAAQPSEESYMRGTYVTTDAYRGKGYSPRSSDGKFAPLTQYLHPFRACFSVSDLSGAGARGSLGAVFLDEDGVTVIDEFDAVGSPDNAPKTIYTLSGQRISEVKRSGIYIVNGEKQYIEVK